MRTTPQPEFRQHKTVSQGDFAPGTAIAQGETARVAIPVASATKLRFRMKASRAGDLDASFLRPGIQAGEYSRFDEELDGTAEVLTTGAPTTVAVSADTEALIEVDCAGESWVLVEFTEGGVGAGVITWANYCQL